MSQELLSYAYSWDVFVLFDDQKGFFLEIDLSRDLHSGQKFAVASGQKFAVGGCIEFV